MVVQHTLGQRHTGADGVHPPFQVRIRRGVVQDGVYPGRKRTSTAWRISSSTCCSRGPRTVRRAVLPEEIDAVGGQLNAFTAKEYTCFYTKVMDEHIPIAIDILGDIVCNPLFDEKDIRNEKNVIAEEILMAEDTPEDVCHETLMGAALGEHPLSHPILGSQESIGDFTRDQIRSFYDDHYATGPCIISASGHFDEAEMHGWLTDAFCGWKRHNSPLHHRRPARGYHLPRYGGLPQKGYRADPSLHGVSRRVHRRRHTVPPAGREYRPGGRHQLPAVSEYPGGKGTGLRDLLLSL